MTETESRKEKICHDLAIEAAKLSFLRDEKSNKNNSNHPLTKPGEIAEELRKNYAVAIECLQKSVKITGE